MTYVSKGKGVHSVHATHSRQPTMHKHNFKTSAMICARVGRLGHSARVTLSRLPAKQSLSMRV